MNPLILIIPALLIGGAAAASSKKRTGTSEVDQVYQQAMDPAMLDLTWLRQAVAFLQSKGATQQASNVSARIASIQATQAADAAARAEAERARQEWERLNGGRPTQAQLDRVWAQVLAGELDKPTLQYAWTLFETYGTPERAAETKRRIDAMTAAPPPYEPPTVVVDRREGGEPVVVPPPQPVTPPPVAPPAAPPVVVTPPVAPPVVVAPPAAPPVVVTPPVAPPVSPPPETAPEVDPIGTIALARKMISVEDEANWKTKLQPEIRVWQAKAGLTVDGKFGKKGAYRMAEEVGVLPRVRYWSKGDLLPSCVTAYRTKLLEIADQLERAGKREHAAALRVSAANETGQGYPSKPPAVPTQQRIDEALDVVAAVTEAVGEQNVSALYREQPWLAP